MVQATLDTTVTGLQGTPVSATPPVAGQILVFNGTSWVPSSSINGPLSVSGSAILGALSVTGAATLPTINGPSNINQATINQPAIMGVTDGSNAAPGEVGEYVTASGSAITIPTSATNATLLTTQLTAGVWLIWGGVNFNTTSTIYNTPSCSIQVNGVVLPLPGMRPSLVTAGNPIIWAASMPIGPGLVSVSAPATVIVTGQITFTGTATITGTGYLAAVRIR